MKIGKVAESVLKRSVIRQIHARREEVLVGAGVGEDCAALMLPEGEAFVMSTDPITGTVKDIGRLAVHITANDIASAGAEPVGIMLSVLLPESVTEEDIRTMMAQAEAACGELRIQTIGGHTEVTRAVNQPVITATGVGRIRREKLVLTGGAKPGQDIVVSKWIGLEGTSILAKERERELLQRFARTFVQEAKSFDRYLSIVPEAAVAAAFGVSAMHDVTEGGIFGALWEMAEAAKVGVEADIKKIPVRQETVEVCEFFGVSPYGLISSGSLLMAADNGGDLVRELEKHGIFAVTVGKFTVGNDRVVTNGEERRFLEPPGSDELYRALDARAGKGEQE